MVGSATFPDFRKASRIAMTILETLTFAAGWEPSVADPKHMTVLAP